MPMIRIMCSLNGKFETYYFVPSVPYLNLTRLTNWHTLKMNSKFTTTYPQEFKIVAHNNIWRKWLFNMILGKVRNVLSIAGQHFGGGFKVVNFFSRLSPSLKVENKNFLVSSFELKIRKVWCARHSCFVLQIQKRKQNYISFFLEVWILSSRALVLK